jgi:hypothetical protein
VGVEVLVREKVAVGVPVGVGLVVWQADKAMLP